MKQNPEQQRLKDLLTDTICLLCKNGLQFKSKFSVEALIGITLDEDDVILVNINEIIQNKAAEAAEAAERALEEEETAEKRRKRKRKRRSSRSSSGTEQQGTQSTQSEEDTTRENNGEADETEENTFSIKEEPDEELIIIKEEPGLADFTQYQHQQPASFPDNLAHSFSQSPQFGNMIPLTPQGSLSQPNPSPSWQPSPQLDPLSSTQPSLLTGQMPSPAGSQVFLSHLPVAEFQTKPFSVSARSGEGRIRQRTRFEKWQLNYLREAFKKVKSASGKTLDLYSQATGLPSSVIRVWFKNARSKCKQNLLPEESSTSSQLDHVASLSNDIHDHMKATQEDRHVSNIFHKQEQTFSGFQVS